MCDNWQYRNRITDWCCNSLLDILLSVYIIKLLFKKNRRWRTSCLIMGIDLSLNFTWMMSPVNHCFRWKLNANNVFKKFNILIYLRTIQSVKITELYLFVIKHLFFLYENWRLKTLLPGIAYPKGLYLFTYLYFSSLHKS